MPAAATIGAAVIGGVASSSAARRASSDTRAAANASTAANQANIELAREQRARNEQLFAQYLGDENLARAYLDALDFGSGSYTPGATGVDGLGATEDWQGYLERNPDVLAEARRNGREPTEFAQWHWQNYGQFEGRQGPVSADGGAAGASAQTFTRDQVMAMLAGTPLAQFAERDYAGRNELIDASYDSETGDAQTAYEGFNSRAVRDRDYRYGEIDDELDASLGRYDDDYATRTGAADTALNRDLGLSEADLDARRGAAGARRGETEGIAQDFYDDSMSEAGRIRGERQGQADTGLAERYAEADSVFGQRTDEAALARADREGTAAYTRAGMRGVGDENFSRARALLDGSYATRQGLTTNAVSAWNALAQESRDRGIDAAASRLGVTGQTGRAVRTIGDVEQSYARDRSLYEADRRLEDFNTYDAGLMGADADLGSVYLGAEDRYGDDIGRAGDIFADDTSRAIDLRSGARTGAYDSYDDSLRALVDYYGGDVNRARAALADARSGAADTYYDETGAAYDRYGAARDTAYGRNDSLRRSAFDTQASARDTAYGQAGERRRSAYDAYSDADSSAYGGLADANRSAGLRRSAARTSAFDTRAGDRVTSYADFRNALSERANRGYSARANIASGGQSFVDAATAANNSTARAQSDAAYRRGEINQQLYGDLSRIAGDAWGSIRRNNSGSSSNINMNTASPPQYRDGRG